MRSWPALPLRTVVLLSIACLPEHVCLSIVSFRRGWTIWVLDGACDLGEWGSDGLGGNQLGECVPVGPGHPIGWVSGQLTRVLVQFRQVPSPVKV